MSKIFIIGNTNFGIKDLKKSNIIFEYFNNVFIPYIKKNSTKDDVLIHSGNLFSEHNLSIKSINLVQKIFEEISEYITVYFLIGKYDVEDIDISTNIFTIFKNYKNIKIIDKIETLNNVVCVPYTKYDKNDFKHQNSIVILNDNIDIENIKKSNKYIINSDFFNFKDNIINMGSPYQMNKDNEGKQCGFLIIENNEIRFNENDISPIYITYDLKDVNDFFNLKKTFDKNNYNYLKIYSSFDEMNINYDMFKKKNTNIKIINIVDEVFEDDEIDNEKIDFKQSTVDEMIINYVIKLENSDKILEEFNLLKNKKLPKIK
jgi:hypothetical protein